MITRVFSRASSAVLVGEELHVAVEALEHSARVLSEGPQDNVTAITITRRRKLADRLRRAIVK